MKYLIGNWKMYLDYQKSLQLYKKIDMLPSTRGLKIAVCPSFPVLGALKTLTNKQTSYGAQDVSLEDLGAYTSQVSAAMLKQMGVKYCIIGHSERRRDFAESDILINKKLHILLQYKITPVICVGEALAQRKAGEEKKVVRQQLQKIFQNISIGNEKIIIAYEPIWAIGTGKACLPDDAQAMHAYIKGWYAKKYAGKNVVVVYGGSVKPQNVELFLSKAEIDGALVGGSSVQYSEFAAMVKKTQSL